MKIARLLVIAAMIAPVCRADDSLALANKYLELTGAPAFLQQSFESGIKSSLDRMRAQGAPAELVDSIQSEAHGFFLENFKWDEVKPKLAKLYADTFTEAELREIDAFYETPAGQKAVAKLPTLMQVGGQIAMSGVQEKMPEFQQHVAAMVQNYKAKEAEAAQKPAPGGVTVPAQPTK
jgi:Uncharacterized protein conserved in bacteria (DUF2059)